MNPSQDQHLAVLRDGLPPLWYAVYRGCIQAGFTTNQAWMLTQVWICSQSKGSLNLPGNPEAGAAEEAT